MRLARAMGAGALAAVLLAGAAGCGGSGEGDGGAAGGNGGSSGGSSGPALNPEDGEEAVLDEDADQGPEASGPLSASEVAAGLRVVKELARTATAALGPNELELVPEDAPALQAQIAAEWSNVAPSVKERDAGTATALEEAFPAFGAAIGAKDQAAAGAAADRIAGAVDAYVARFPPDNPPAEMPDEDEDGLPDSSGEDPGDGSMPGFGGPSAAPSPTSTP